MEPGVKYSPAPPAPPAQIESKGSIIPIIASLVLAVAVVGAGIWFVTKYRQPQPQTVIEAQVTPTPKATRTSPTPASTAKIAGWEEYADPNNNFYIQYPTQYQLTPYTESSFSGIELEFLQPATTASSSAQSTLKIIYLNNSAKTAAQFASEQAKLEGSTVNQAQFANLQALEIPLAGEWGRGKILFFESQGTVYRIASIIAAPLNVIPSISSQVDQILATFKVLDYTQRGK